MILEMKNTINQIKTSVESLANRMHQMPNRIRVEDTVEQLNHKVNVNNKFNNEISTENTFSICTTLTRVNKYNIFKETGSSKSLTDGKCGFGRSEGKNCEYDPNPPKEILKELKYFKKKKPHKHIHRTMLLRQFLN